VALWVQSVDVDPSGMIADRPVETISVRTVPNTGSVLGAFLTGVQAPSPAIRRDLSSSDRFRKEVVLK